MTFWELWSLPSHWLQTLATSSQASGYLASTHLSRPEDIHPFAKAGSRKVVLQWKGHKGAVLTETTAENEKSEFTQKRKVPTDSPLSSTSATAPKEKPNKNKAGRWRQKKNPVMESNVSAWSQLSHPLKAGPKKYASWQLTQAANSFKYYWNSPLSLC